MENPKLAPFVSFSSLVFVTVAIGMFDWAEFVYQYIEFYSEYSFSVLIDVMTVWLG